MAAKHYNGRMLLRFDDTNPTKENVDFVESIKADLATLGVIPDSVSFTSDSFDIIFAYAEQMIAEGTAYVDDTPREQMQAWRMDRVESPARANSVARNQELWQEMVNGTELGQTLCLRAKIDMQNNNATLRDPYACQAGWVAGWMAGWCLCVWRAGRQRCGHPSLPVLVLCGRYR